MDIEKLIQTRFAQSITAKEQALATALPSIIQACQLLINILAYGHKVLICGNGGSAADAQHFAAELVMRYETSRHALPAIALTTDSSAMTAISNDLAYEQIFSRQVEALGQPGDVLVAISTSGNSANIISAIGTAHNQDMSILALTGRDGGTIAQLCKPGDIEIRVPDMVTGRVQETHILIIHCLCEAMDKHFTKEPI